MECESSPKLNLAYNLPPALLHRHMQIHCDSIEIHWICCEIHVWLECLPRVPSSDFKFMFWLVGLCRKYCLRLKQAKKSFTFPFTLLEEKSYTWERWIQFKNLSTLTLKSMFQLWVILCGADKITTKSKHSDWWLCCVLSDPDGLLALAHRVQFTPEDNTDYQDVKIKNAISFLESDSTTFQFDCLQV